MTKQASTDSGTVCHILPCSIEEDITAPIAQYFHPTPLPAAVLPKKNGDDTAKIDDATIIMAAQFRGRGLLCAVDIPPSDDAAAEEGSPESNDANGTPSSKPTEEDVFSAPLPLSKLPSNIVGAVLAQSSTGGHTTTTTTSTTTSNSDDPPVRSLNVVESFRHVYHWSHEHEAERVARERRGNERCGLNAALGWCDLAREVSAACAENGVREWRFLSAETTSFVIFCRCTIRFRCLRDMRDTRENPSECAGRRS